MAQLQQRLVDTDTTGGTLGLLISMKYIMAHLQRQLMDTTGGNSGLLRLAHVRIYIHFH